MYCQSGEIERAVVRSGWVGKKVSKYDAGSEIIKLETRSIERHGGKQNHVAEQSNGKVLRADF